MTNPTSPNEPIEPTQATEPVAPRSPASFPQPKPTSFLDWFHVNSRLIPFFWIGQRNLGPDSGVHVAFRVDSREKCLGVFNAVREKGGLQERREDDCRQSIQLRRYRTLH